MNIFVCIKQVPDTETKIRINGDKTGIDSSGVKWIISPYDEFAIEEAVRLKEKNPGSTVTVISAGPDRVTEAIRSALALGADTGLQIDLPENADSFLTAKALSGALKKEKFDIVFTGKEAIDDGAAQVSQLLASFLDIPAVTVVLGCEYQDGAVKCRREVEGGTIEVIEAKLPVVLAAQKGLNDPRYASLPNIMKAKKKEVKKLTLSDLDVSPNEQKVKYKNFELPPPKKPGRKLEGTVEQQVVELARLLREEAKVI